MKQVSVGCPLGRGGKTNPEARPRAGTTGDRRAIGAHGKAPEELAVAPRPEPEAMRSPAPGAKGRRGEYFRNPPTKESC